MLREIHFENMAVFSASDVCFSSGMTVLTGETGAGKSLIIGAVSLLLGARTIRSYVKEDGQNLHIEALFSTEDIDLTEEERALYGDELLITRDIQSNGRSTVRINQRMTTTAALKELGQKLICIHGQHDNQTLLNENSHLGFLDAYGCIDTSKFREVFSLYKKAEARKTELEIIREEAARRTDYLAFAVDEIEKVAPKCGEDIALQEQKMRLKNAEKLFRLLNEAESAVSGKGEEGVGEAYVAVKSAVQYDPSLAALEEKLIDIYDAVQEIAPMIAEVKETLTDDPSALSEILERISEIEQLKRKYGGTIESILSYKQQSEQELLEIANSVTEASEIDDKIKILSHRVEVEAQKLSETRLTAAEKLAARITEELSDLGMEKARFHVACIPCTLCADGKEKVQFQIETNPGAGFGPLSKIASGGELSRVMLALKSALHEIDPTPTLIFDEIDVGISGAAAKKVGKKMKEVAKNCQVIVVTHLQQIAAFADDHFKVSKEETDVAYTAKIKLLSETERVDEIVRLMVGEEKTEAAVLAAKELLNGAQNG